MLKPRVLLLDFEGHFLEPMPRDQIMQYLGSQLGGGVDIDYQGLASGRESANVSVGHWVKIARVVHDSYKLYDGFVIWHPIDSLALAAAGISFIFENLSKPVVVTGALVPFQEPRTDAISNLTNSLSIAAYRAFGLPKIPEVIVCFGSKILRAVRTRHASSSSFDSFESQGFPPLGQIGKSIRIRRKLLRRAPPKRKRFAINDCLEPGVLSLELFPGFSSRVMSEIILREDLKGIVLKLFGECNLLDYLDIFDAAKQRGTVVLNIAPAESANNSLLRKHGVIRASSALTGTAAHAKLSVTLGRTLSRREVEKLLKYDLRGEQSETRGRVEDLWLSAPDVESTLSLVEEINDEVLRYVRQNPTKIHDLSPRAFEMLVAEIFKHHGYDVELTPKTRDGGFDFSALYVDGLGHSFLSYVEAKRYAPHNPVGVGIVRSLYGVVASSEASRGIIVTSSRFTKEARDFQSRMISRISLHDYDDIKRWLEEIQ